MGIHSLFSQIGDNKLEARKDNTKSFSKSKMLDKSEANCENQKSLGTVSKSTFTKETKEKKKIVKADRVSRKRNAKDKKPSTIKHSTLDKQIRLKKNTKENEKNSSKVKEDETEINEEVKFNPDSDCKACLQGKKGEGDDSCWSCRIKRLMEKQDMMLTRLQKNK